MKQTLKQIGICVFFIVLFVGMQAAAQFVVGYGYIFYGKLSGWQMNADELAASTNDFLENSGEFITLVSGCITILAVWLFSKVRKKKFAQECNLVPFHTKCLLPISFMVIGFSLAISGCFALLPETVMESYDIHIGSDDAGIVIMFLSTALVAPIVEELIFRGIVMRRLNKVMNIYLAAFLSSMTFGILHGNIVQITYAVVLGLVMSFIAVRCASLLASCFFHIFFNSIGNFSIIPAFLGDTFVVNIIAGIVGLVIAVTAIIWLYKINDVKPGAAAAA